MDKRSNFGSLHTAEAAFELLEREGCDHFHALERCNFPIGADARDGLSPEAIAAAKRVAMKFWRDHGREAARQATIEKLAQVILLFQYFLQLLFFIWGIERGIKKRFLGRF